MQGYRFYLLNADGRIIGREEFAAETDEAALAKARALFATLDCPAFELWQERRQVFRGGRS